VYKYCRDWLCRYMALAFMGYLQAAAFSHVQRVLADLPGSWVAI